MGQGMNACLRGTEELNPYVIRSQSLSEGQAKEEMNKGGTSQPQLKSETVKALVVKEPTHITTTYPASLIYAS